MSHPCQGTRQAKDHEQDGNVGGIIRSPHCALHISHHHINTSYLGIFHVIHERKRVNPRYNGRFHHHDDAYAAVCIWTYQFGHGRAVKEHDEDCCTNTIDTCLFMIQDTHTVHHDGHHCRKGEGRPPNVLPLLTIGTHEERTRQANDHGACVYDHDGDIANEISIQKID